MSENIEWGPAIAVDGKRPGWLEKSDMFLAKGLKSWYGSPWGGDHLQLPHWEPVSHIRLPADHPHYRQPAPIDWSGELEAVHEDGRVVAVRLSERDQPDRDGDYCLSEFLEPRKSQGMYFKADGSQSYDSGGGRLWRIRNVTPQPTPQADTKPDVTARMEALVRKVDHRYHHGVADYQAIGREAHEWMREAAAIVALLPEPVDPLEEAKTVLDVFLAAYQAMPDTTLVERGPDDDLLTYGHLRTILRALTGEAGK